MSNSQLDPSEIPTELEGALISDALSLTAAERPSIIQADPETGEVLKSPLSGLRPFRPAVQRISQEEFRRQQAAAREVQQAAPPDDRMTQLEGQIGQLAVAVGQLATLFVQSQGSPMPISPSPSTPPPRLVSQNPPLTLHPAVEEPKEVPTGMVGAPWERSTPKPVSSSGSEPPVTPLPGVASPAELVTKAVPPDVFNRVRVGVKSLIASKNNWKVFRSLIRRSGGYRPDRWPQPMIDGVHAHFQTLLADDQLISRVVMSCIGIEPALAPEKAYLMLVIAAGWTAWLGYSAGV